MVELGVRVAGGGLTVKGKLHPTRGKAAALAAQLTAAAESISGTSVEPAEAD
jgi:hypothetical protein